MSFFEPNQLENILPFLPWTPKWFILGGPGDAREAQHARQLWPDVKIIGIEPNQQARNWQHVNGWPEDAIMLSAALGNKHGEYVDLVLEDGHLRNASIDPEAVTGNRGNPACTFRRVQMTTLDVLDSLYGPFEDVVIWLDIEGSEHLALQGASELLNRKAVMLWNLELMDRVPGLVEGVEGLLKDCTAVKDWDASDHCRNRIFVRKG